jgi:hypothetical protein
MREEPKSYFATLGPLEQAVAAVECALARWGIEPQPFGGDPDADFWIRPTTIEDVHHALQELKEVAEELYNETVNHSNLGPSELLDDAREGLDEYYLAATKVAACVNYIGADGRRVSPPFSIAELPDLPEDVRRAIRRVDRQWEAALDANGDEETPPTSTDPDESGYVADPTDPSAYVPVTEILNKHTPPDLDINMKRLIKILEDFQQTRVRWTRPKGPDGQPWEFRRSVHLADWIAFCERFQQGAGAAGEYWPSTTEEELQARAKAIRSGKGHGK